MSCRRILNISQHLIELWQRLGGLVFVLLCELKRPTADVQRDTVTQVSSESCDGYIVVPGIC